VRGQKSIVFIGLVLFVLTAVRPALAIPPNGQQQLLVEVGSSVLSFDPFTGQSYGSFATGVTTPRGMTIGWDGEVYVCSVNTSTVLRYDLHTGTLLGQFASSRPNDVTIGPDGDVYVLSEIGGTIGKFAPDGTSLGTMITDSRISPGRTLAFGPDGNIYVGATGLGVVQRINGKTCAFMGTFASDPKMMDPFSLTFGPDGDLYVLDPISATDCVWQFDTAGKLVGKFNSGGMLYSPSDLAFGKDGNLYIANWGPTGVDRYSSQTGAYMDQFISLPGLPSDMVFNPEPGVLGLAGLAMLVVRRRRR